MWISKSDLLALGVSDATIWRKDRNGDWTSRVEEATGREGRPSKEYLLSSLPTDLQLKWARLDSERRASATADSDSSVSRPVEYDRLQKLVAALARFSPPAYSLEQKEAVQRRCVEMGKLCDAGIALIAKLKSTTGISVVSPGSREAGLNRAYHPDLAKLAQLTGSTDPIYIDMYPSAAKPLSVSTFLRLIDKYRKQGLVAFIRQQQTLSPAKDERFLDIPQQAINWLQANLKSYVNASVSLFGQRWLEWAARNGVTLPLTEYAPSKPKTCYTWLYRWKQNVPNAAMVLARDGARKFDARFAIIIRDYENLQPRVGWTMDWRTSDLPCWLPFNKDKSKLPVLVREYVCSVFDLKARALFGYHIADRPHARGVTLAYVDAITKSAWKSEAGFEMLCGMQRGANDINAFALWDNGKEFVARLVEGKEIKVGRIELENGLIGVLDSYKVGLAVDAQITIRHAKPYNAKSKTVEPFHRYGIGLWEEGMPGYCGKRPEDKPHYYAAALRIHKAFMHGNAPKPEDLRQLPPLWRDQYDIYKMQFGYGTPFLSQADFRAAFARRMVEYNLKPHGSLKNERGELSPIEYLNLYAETPHLMTETTIAALMMEPREVTIDADRIILRWFGDKFFYHEVRSDLSDGTALLRLPEKTKVEVRYNPDNIGRALVLTKGTLLCWVESPELLGWNASREHFQRANARKKQAKRVAEEFYKVQSESTDWRDEAAADMPTQLPIAVNAGQVFEPDESTDQHPASPVTVLTRFDRKSSDAPGKLASVSPLRVVAPKQEADDWNDLIEPEPITPKDADDWVEPWK